MKIEEENQVQNINQKLKQNINDTKIKVFKIISNNTY